MAKNSDVVVRMTREQARNFERFLGSLEAQKLVNTENAPFLTRLHLGLLNSNADRQDKKILTVGPLNDVLDMREVGQ